MRKWFIIHRLRSLGGWSRTWQVEQCYGLRMPKLTSILFIIKPASRCPIVNQVSKGDKEVFWIHKSIATSNLWVRELDFDSWLFSSSVNFWWALRFPLLPRFLRFPLWVCPWCSPMSSLENFYFGPCKGMGDSMIRITDILEGSVSGQKMSFLTQIGWVYMTQTQFWDLKSFFGCRDIEGWSWNPELWTQGLLEAVVFVLYLFCFQNILPGTVT